MKNVMVDSYFYEEWVSFVKEISESEITEETGPIPDEIYNELMELEEQIAKTRELYRIKVAEIRSYIFRQHNSNLVQEEINRILVKEFPSRREKEEVLFHFLWKRIDDLNWSKDDQTMKLHEAFKQVKQNV